MLQLSRLTAALVVVLVSATAAHAQSSRQIRPATSVAPSATARATQAAPNPAGLRPLFPAGITSGSGVLVTSDPVAASSAPLTVGTTGTGTTGSIVGATTGTNRGGTGGTLLPPDSAFTANGPALPSDVNTGLDGGSLYNAGAATMVMGAAGGGLARGPAQTVPSGGAGFSAVDIARSFIVADGNRDGELTRSEARRLTLSMQSFEEMDRNFDGVISRAEYEDGLR